jgi:hypothetical protein
MCEDVTLATASPIFASSFAQSILGQFEANVVFATHPYPRYNGDVSWMTIWRTHEYG